MNTHDEFILRTLLDDGVIDAGAADRARRAGVAEGRAATRVLIDKGECSGREIAIATASVCEVPYADLSMFEIDISWAQRVPRSLAERFVMFPLWIIDGIATVGMSDPLDLQAIDKLRQVLKAEIDPVACEGEALSALIAHAYSLSSGGTDSRESVGFGHETDSDDDAGDAEPAVAAVNQILADAVRQGASDVHISPGETELELRYRVDGQLQRRQGPPLSAHASIVQRLKVLAHLDLTQTRRPQDGKFRCAGGGEPVEVRLSTMPTVNGENVVMRLLRQQTELHDFVTLGMNPAMGQRLEELLERPHGMVLVTGPTGSGKTSTLYTGIKKINTPDVNIMTIEDPVEIRLPGIRQIQANPEVGLTFANALRSVLRQDPDIVLVGEIRDTETALIALQASLTGHLVLSTLHTNDAAGAITRLQDLGVPSFVINASVLGVVGQRLIRKVCADCVGPCDPDPVLLRRFGLGSHERFVTGRGCARCGGTGFAGRIGVYELLEMTPEVAESVERGASSRELGEIARRQGWGTMGDDALDKARKGLTTLEEVARVVGTIDVSRMSPQPMSVEAA
ncbi:MAG: GspE/PulE family protein [Phycisphaerales bacterium]